MLLAWWFPVVSICSAEEKVRYLMRTERWSSPYWDNLENIEALGEVDDTPMFGSPLGFEFPFLTKSRRIVFVNPNGAVAFRPGPPCQSYFGQSGACTTNSSWFGLIALLVIDLDPSANGNVSVGGDSESFAVVRFENVSYYGATPAHPTVTIGTRIHRDGLVEIFHEQVDEARGGLVGIRFDDPDEEDESSSSSRVSSTQAQLDRMKLWGTEVAGAYPGNLPVDNTRVVACPMPEDWCAEVVDESTLDLVAPFFGCAQELDTFNFKCVLVADDHRYIIASGTSLLVGEEDGLRCDFSASANRSLVVLLSSDWNVKIWYDAPTGDRDGGVGDGGLETTVLGFREVVTNQIGLCDDSSLTNETNSTDCHLVQGSYFSRADCSGCLPTLSPSSSSSNDDDFAAVSFASDDGVCCDWRDMDCLGSCTGKAYPRRLTPEEDGRDHEVVVCQCDRFDCAGTCGGDAVRDECQVCGGNGTSIDACGVCGGSVQNSSLCVDVPPPSNPQQPTRAPTRDPKNGGLDRQSSSSGGGFLRNLNDHPWIVVIVALEVFISIACFKSCTSRRAAALDGSAMRRRRRRRQPTSSDGLSPDDSNSATATLTQSDLDDLVQSSLSSETDEMFYVEHGVSAGLRRTTALSVGGGGNGDRSSTRRRFLRRENASSADGTLTLDDVRARVAEAYEVAVASLCATPTESGDGEDNTSDDAVCAICLDPLRDDATRPVKLPNCDHEFHRDCVLHWLTSHNSCPYCKRRAVERVEPSTTSNTVVHLRVLPATTPSLQTATTALPEADVDPSDLPSSTDTLSTTDVEMRHLNTTTTDGEVEDGVVDSSE